MVFIKHNSLKSDIYFNSTFIPCFLGSKFLRVQDFQGPDFSESRFFRVQVFLGPGFPEAGFSGSRFFWFKIFQGPDPGFRSSPLIIIYIAKIWEHDFFYVLTSLMKHLWKRVQFIPKAFNSIKQRGYSKIFFKNLSGL